MTGLSRRGIVGGLSAAATLVAATAPDAPVRAAEAPNTTWEQIKSTKILRVGAAQAELWYTKDNSGSSAPGAVQVGDTTWRGVCPLVAKELADTLGVQLQLVETTWGNAVAGLQTNQFDVMFVMDGTPQRAMAIDFVETPMLWYPMVLLAKDGVKVATWADANNPSFSWGVALGTSNDQFVSRLAPKATIMRLQDNSEVVAAFQSGRIDGIVATGPYADLIRARLHMGKVIVPKPAVALPAGTGIRQEVDHRWKDFLGTSLGFWYRTGRMQEWFDYYLTYRGVDPASVTSIIRENWT